MRERNGKKQFHVTMLRQMEFCGEQFRRRYIEEEKIPPSAFAIVGRGVDKSATRNLQQKIDTKELLPLDEIKEIARDSVISDIANDDVWVDPEEQKTKEQIEGDAVDKAVRLAALHANELAPKIHPRKVQREFAIMLPGYDFDLVGTLDIDEEEDHVDESGQITKIVRVRDTKTKRSKPAENAAEISEQLTGYALALHVIDKRAPDEVTLDFLVDTKTPSAVVRTAKRNKVDFDTFLRRLQIAAVAIEKGVFIPVNPADPLCSPKWCGYYSTCKYTVNPVTIALSAKKGKR